MSEPKDETLVITRDTTVVELLTQLLRRFSATGQSKAELHYQATTDGVPARLVIVVSIQANPEGMH